MTAKDCCDIMEKVNIRPTSIRILVYEAISGLQDTFSLSDLENALVSVDKSSIFRTLTLFHKKHLIHSVDDGSGYLKYCICYNQGECNEEEKHCHFYCERCKKTYCLESDIIPNILLPEDFIIMKVNYVVKGICANCVKKTKITYGT